MRRSGRCASLAGNGWDTGFLVEKGSIAHLQAQKSLKHQLGYLKARNQHIDDGFLQADLKTHEKFRFAEDHFVGSPSHVASTCNAVSINRLTYSKDGSGVSIEESRGREARV